MEAVLSGVLTSQGVMGGLVMDDSGRVLVESLPSLFDKDQVAHAALVLAEQEIGLEELTGGVRLAELRFELGKLIVRPIAERSLVLICEHGANLQMLSIALNVAAKKIEKIPLAPAASSAAATAPRELTPPTPSGTGWTFMPLPVQNGKQLLRVSILEKPVAPSGSRWKNISRSTGPPVAASGVTPAATLPKSSFWPISRPVCLQTSRYRSSSMTRRASMTGWWC